MPRMILAAFFSSTSGSTIVRNHSKKQSLTCGSDIREYFVGPTYVNVSKFSHFSPRHARRSEKGRSVAGKDNLSRSSISASSKSPIQARHIGARDDTEKVTQSGD